MNLESELVFIVGPGGAGKSTTGKLLAEKLDYKFVDVDAAFNSRIALIPYFVRDNGYKAYCETNSKLVEDLIAEYSSKIVMPLPSGFLVHEDSPELVIKHKSLLSANDVSILLLPSKSLDETIDIIVKRQLTRGFTDMIEEREREVITRRHPLYMHHGDIQIFSYKSPEQIANLMVLELNRLRIIKT